MEHGDACVGWCDFHQLQTSIKSGIVWFSSILIGFCRLRSLPTAWEGVKGNDSHFGRETRQNWLTRWRMAAVDDSRLRQIQLSDTQKWVRPSKSIESRKVNGENEPNNGIPRHFSSTERAFLPLNTTRTCRTHFRSRLMTYWQAVRGKSLLQYSFRLCVCVRCVRCSNGARLLLFAPRSLRTPMTAIRVWKMLLFFAWLSTLRPPFSLAVRIHSVLGKHNSPS